MSGGWPTLVPSGHCYKVGDIILCPCTKETVRVTWVGKRSIGVDREWEDKRTEEAVQDLLDLDHDGDELVVIGRQHREG